MAKLNWRRWFQLKLRTAMMIVLALALPLGWFSTRYHRGQRQRPIVEAIEKAGGAVWVVGEWKDKDDNDPRRLSPRIPNAIPFDSQRGESEGLRQMVENAKAGDVVCIAFRYASMMNVLASDGSKRPRVFGQESDLAETGWKLHVDSHTSLRRWGLEPISKEPIVWSAFSVFGSLQVLDLGERPLTDVELQSIGRFAGLRALQVRRAHVTDQGLAAIAKLKNLRVLSLNGTHVTDDGLRHLAGLRRLEVLELDHSAVRGHGLKHLAGLSQLKLLSLRGAPLEDSGLKHLGGLTELRRLYCSGTLVSDAELRFLQPLKNLEILHLGKTAVTFAGADAFEKQLGRAVTIR
jgi:Leucine-rich repeat (LRR) protein